MLLQRIYIGDLEKNSTLEAKSKDVDKEKKKKMHQHEYINGRLSLQQEA